MRIARLDAESVERLIARFAASALLLAIAGCARSAGASGHWATVNGHRLYYEIRGDGPPVVLLHAGGDDIQRTFAAQLGPFSARHRVIALEQVGHGHTPDVRGPLTYTGMLQDTVAVLRQLKVANADIIGLSDGGILALMLAARHPELVRRVVASGANIDPSGLVPAAIERVRSMVGDSDPFGDKLGRLWLYSPKPEELSVDLLKTIQQPVLVMAGDQDLITRQHTQLIYHSLPHGQLWIVPSTGHDTFAEQPATVNSAILSFLDEGEARQ